MRRLTSSTRFRVRKLDKIVFDQIELVLVLHVSLAMVAIFLLVRAKREIVCTSMTTPQKTAAIRSILTNHEDNVAAVRGAKVSAGLDAIVIEAMNAALKDDLVLIFACKPVNSGNG